MWFDITSKPSLKLIKLISSAHNNQYPKLQLIITVRHRDLKGLKELLAIAPALKIGGDDSGTETEPKELLENTPTLPTGDDERETTVRFRTLFSHEREGSSQ